MGSGGDKTVVQQNEPPKYVQPYLENLAKNSQGLYERGGLAPVAGFNPEQTRAQQGVLDFVYSPQTQQGVQTAQNSLTGLLTASDVANNPVVQNLLNTQTNAITQAYREQILPSITGESVMTGGIGGSRQGVAQGLAAERTAGAIGDSATQLLSNAYSRGLTAQAQGLALAPGITQLPLQLYGAAEAVGGQRRSMDQAQQEQERMALKQLGELLGISTGGANTSTQTESGGETNSLLAGLGGAATGMTVGAKLGGSVGGWWGAGIGALIGLFS